MLAAAAPFWGRWDVACEIVAKAQTPGVYADSLGEVGYRVWHVPAEPQWSLPRRIYGVVRETRPDVVHVHTEHANFWIAAAALAAGVRVLRTFHAAYDFSGPLRQERRVQRGLLRAAGVRSVAVSQAVARNELELFGSPTPVIPNWIDTTRFTLWPEQARRNARWSVGIDPSRLLLVSVGNCAQVKNHRLILEIVAKVPRVVYLHVGQEDARLSERMAAERLGIADRVHFLGHRADVLPVLQAADVFVMSSHREGSPLAAIEALACGLPCLLANTTGLRDLAGGTAARVFDSAEQAVGILSALDEADASQWRQQSQDSAMRVRAFHSPQTGVATYVRVYHDLIGGVAGGR